MAEIILLNTCRQVPRHAHPKITPANPATSEVVQELPESCRIVGELLREPRFGPTSTNIGRCWPNNLGQTRRHHNFSNTRVLTWDVCMRRPHPDNGNTTSANGDATWRQVERNEHRTEDNPTRPPAPPALGYVCGANASGHSEEEGQKHGPAIRRLVAWKLAKIGLPELGFGRTSAQPALFDAEELFSSVKWCR